MRSSKEAHILRKNRKILEKKYSNALVEYYFFSRVINRSKASEGFYKLYNWIFLNIYLIGTSDSFKNRNVCMIQGNCLCLTPFVFCWMNLLGEWTGTTNKLLLFSVAMKFLQNAEFVGRWWGSGVRKRKVIESSPTKSQKITQKVNKRHRKATAVSAATIDYLKWNPITDSNVIWHIKQTNGEPSVNIWKQDINMGQMEHVRIIRY